MGAILHLHPVVLILVAVSFGAIAQLLLKTGIDSVKGDTVGFTGLIIAAFTNLRVLVGFVLYAFGSVLWIVVLSKAELSYAYPMIALAYVVVTILSKVFLHEEVTLVRWSGLALICCGVFLISRS